MTVLKNITHSVPYNFEVIGQAYSKPGTVYTTIIHDVHINFVSQN